MNITLLKEIQIFDLMTATDLSNLAYSRVEDDFNKHPEWDDLLKDLEKALDKVARRIIRLDSMNIWCGKGDDFDLEKYVDLSDQSHDEKDILNLGCALITLLKLNGFQITDEKYQNGNVDSRLLSFVINLGGTENGTQ